jgi:ubiquinone/menaquinone biosynthesis C-methylase UbiE
MRKLLASAKAGLSCRAENGFILSSSKNWDRRVADAELLARSAGFRDLRDRIVALARPRAGDVVVDLGSGTGLLALAFASRSSRVWAIDSSAAMNEYLDVKAASAGLTNLETVRASVISLPLVDGTADLVVSNYCLHELDDRDKELALAEAMRVLKPGGRLLIADMMFSLNPLAARDRRVITDKLRQLARRGLPGIWRVIKNSVRLASGRWERPASAGWWRDALVRCGFEHVRVEILAHEGGIAIADAPAGRFGRARSPIDQAAVSTQIFNGSPVKLASVQERTA